MDDNSLLRDSWTWMDEDLRLDVGSPPAMPDCIWDDLVDNEAVVRSLFPSSPLKDSDPLGVSLEQQDSLDCNPAPLKRRRILELSEDNLMEINSCLPEPSEASNDFLVAVCEDLQRADPSSSSGSAWYITNEESLSSVDDNIEQSSGSWRIDCISDNDTNHVQGLVHCPVDSPLTTKAIADCKKSVFMPPTKRTMSSAISKGGRQIHRQTLNSPGYGQCTKSWQDIVETSSRLKKPLSAQPSKDCLSSRECAIPVLAYPFALVKPIGIQGHITLQDINQRINSSPGRVKTCFEQPKSTSSSPYSGKSVLALTKIYTEGNGTITIMRTKG
ncbi:hypothetical protein GOP47_0016839 [Adiantum capillus-veneris]|uniref:Protein XRI1 n=1 Tax=Adiantum capillus-veneris TaxID=13818 RepID=A0A9D4UIG0_ADICA|nr:hypothetical protein GOP47_0016839 [Adiantum capillus-veneris]